MLASSIIRRAEQATGLADWGEPDFQPRLDLWLEAVRADDGLNRSGHAALDAMALRCARGRLRLEALIAAHPEIEAAPIDAPIVVTGLPRSGTSALASLLADHPPIQSLRYRDVYNPFSGRDQTRTAQRSSDLAEQAIPGIRKLHDTSALAHADDHWLQNLAFGGFGMEDWQAHLPAWRDHYLTEDQTPVYRYLKRALQAMAFLRGSGARWLIKSPQHMEQLPALREVFPDAVVVVTTRPPADVEQSMAHFTNLIAKYQRTGPVPPSYWPQRFAGMAHCFARDRDLFPDLIELPLAEWAADTAGAQQRVWTARGI